MSGMRQSSLLVHTIIHSIAAMARPGNPPDLTRGGLGLGLLLEFSGFGRGIKAMAHGEAAAARGLAGIGGLRGGWGLGG